jgi:hypothetical protein
VPAFKALYPQIDLRLRLSDRLIDITAEGLDAALHLGRPEDSGLKMRVIAECPRVICAAPAYIARRGHAGRWRGAGGDGHDCLNLRFPGAKEFQWTLNTPEGLQKFNISGPFESDDGDVLTAWALDGHGIVLKPVFEVAEHLRAGRLVPVATDTPPLPVTLSLLTPHRRLRDPKVRLFSDFIARHCRAELAGADRGRLAAAIGRIAVGRQQQRHMVMRLAASLIPKRIGTWSRKQRLVARLPRGAQVVAGVEGQLVDPGAKRSRGRIGASVRPSALVSISARTAPAASRRVMRSPAAGQPRAVSSTCVVRNPAIRASFAPIMPGRAGAVSRGRAER